MAKSPRSKSTPGKSRLSSSLSNPDVSTPNSFSYPSGFYNTGAALSTSNCASVSCLKSPGSGRKILTFKCDLDSESPALSSPSTSKHQHALSVVTHCYDENENQAILTPTIVGLADNGLDHDAARLAFSDNIVPSSFSLETPVRLSSTLQEQPTSHIPESRSASPSSHYSTTTPFISHSGSFYKRTEATASRYLSLTPCSELWFKDGNIVLIAEGFAFKVHRGLLERHSEFFESLFSVPQPRNAMDMDLDIDMDSDLGVFEGSQTVEMHDRAEDVYHFLKALYDGLYLVHRPHRPRSTQFPSLVGVLRLSAKYFVSSLRELCLERLAFDWPTTLSGWDVREAESTDEKGVYIPREFSAHPVLVIELAKELGLMECLPSALYDLSRYGPSKIFVGAPGLKDVLGKEKTTMDSAVGSSSPDEHSASTSQDDGVPFVRLSQDLLLRTLRGRERAQRFMHKFVMTRILNRPPSRDCFLRSDPPIDGIVSRGCHESFYYITLNVLRAVGGIACGRDADPLFTLLQAVEMLSRMDFVDGGENTEDHGRKRGLKICGACKVDFADECYRARRAVWRELPKWFGLEDVVGSDWGQK
ncbi:hypothetical protein Moror_17293 [Moniliophthora roreri MCA 2997]|nr:hypothetical protein Moror_17293 [Moniliophthora roreri MCA 2997]KAI3602518.1 hypothetical protein WG66_009285 [Moniliophthora roreri]